MGKKRKKKRHGSGDAGGSDPMAQRFQAGQQAIDKGVTVALMPVAWAGSAIAVFVRELLSSKFYGFFGGIIAATGLALSAENYWVGLGGGQPFIPKIGIADGASVQSLLAVLQGTAGDRPTFLFLTAMAITLQVIEAVPWRKGLGGKRRRGQTIGAMIWILVGLGYAIDLHSTTVTYRDNGLTLPVFVWGLMGLLGAEFGLGLAEKGKE